MLLQMVSLSVSRFENCNSRWLETAPSRGRSPESSRSRLPSPQASSSKPFQCVWAVPRTLGRDFGQKLATKAYGRCGVSSGYVNRASRTDGTPCRHGITTSIMHWYELQHFYGRFDGGRAEVSKICRSFFLPRENRAEFFKPCHTSRESSGGKSQTSEKSRQVTQKCCTLQLTLAFNAGETLYTT